MTPKIELKDFSLSYGAKERIHNLSMKIMPHEIFAIIGPANSGKSSLLKAMNRMTDFNDEVNLKGDILLDGESIYTAEDSTSLRRRIGMVSPLPVGLPMSIRENVTYAPRMAGCKDKAELDSIMEDCLKKAALWDEVKDRLDHLATTAALNNRSRSFSPPRSSLFG
jgi:phosphate transport system ATP-binding protein